MSELTDNMNYTVADVMYEVARLTYNAVHFPDGINKDGHLVKLDIDLVTGRIVETEEDNVL